MAPNSYISTYQVHLCVVLVDISTHISIHPGRLRGQDVQELLLQAGAVPGGPPEQGVFR